MNLTLFKVCVLYLNDFPYFAGPSIISPFIGRILLTMLLGSEHLGVNGVWLNPLYQLYRDGDSSLRLEMRLS